MRLVATLNDQKRAQTLSSYLKRLGIENQLELTANTDWGSSDYGTIICRIWVYEEDMFEKAITLSHEFIENPYDPKYNPEERHILDILEPVQEKMKESPLKLARQPRSPRMPWSREPLGIITLYILIFCCALFVFTDILTAPQVETVPPSIPDLPVLYSPLKKALLFDYPAAFEYIDKLIKIYGIEKLKNLNGLPAEGRTLLEDFYQTPYWTGIYDKFIEHFKKPDSPWTFNAPMFEKIRQGELWRLISPCFLHGGLLHLLFNMIWLVVLGKQIEARIGGARYLVFILAAGLPTNIMQYLMSGFDFLGFSGILCAMATFIWIRQKKAAWEGYHLQSATLGFLLFYIFIMAAIQLVSVYTEVFQGTSIAPPIANAAHLTGLALGLILGSMNYFSLRTSQ